uniref:Uncharacterized protein n=1 Tax=Rhizophora mucronata TaxID=61149 RepID=A0A2P2J1Y2_RHIMU
MHSNINRKAVSYDCNGYRLMELL